MSDILANKKSFRHGVQFAWDATSIELAQVCLRKYYYSMIRCITPKDTSVHLVFGGIYASALETFYKLRAQGKTIDDALIDVVHKAMIDSWDFELSAPKVFDHPAKTRRNLIRTIVWYIEQFAEETEHGLKTYHLETGEPAVELSFTLDVGTDVIFRGHLDRVVEMGNLKYVMDQKTTGGTVGTYFFNQFNPSNQMSLYSWAGRAILDAPISGVIIDAAQIAVNFTRFERGITTRTKAQLDEWYNSAMHTIHMAQDVSMVDGAEEAEKWPMNAASCGNYGGCPFRNLCAASGSVRDRLIRSDYTDHNWDPLVDR